MEINSIFNEFAKAFEKKIDKEYRIRLQFEITEINNGIWQIDINNGNVSIYKEAKIIPEEIFVLSKETLIKLYNSELSPLTAFAQEPNEKGEMCSLIELKNKTEDKKVYLNNKPSDEYIKFLNRLHIFNSNFFSKENLTKIIVDKDNGIKLHNVNGIGLISKFIGEKRIVHAYFSLKKDDILEEPAFEFSVYVINGKGIIKVGDENFKIEARNYYNMNPKDMVYIKNENEELLEILYLGNT